MYDNFTIRAFLLVENTDFTSESKGKIPVIISNKIYVAPGVRMAKTGAADTR